MRKIKATLFRRHEVTETEEWIGSVYLLIKKADISPLVLEQIRARGKEEFSPPDSAIAEVTKDCKRKYTKTPIMYSMKDRVCRLYFDDIDPVNPIFWLDDEFAKTMGDYILSNGEVAISEDGSAIAAGLAFTFREELTSLAKSLINNGGE
jgi:hypothetical protein